MLLCYKDWISYIVDLGRCWIWDESIHCQCLPVEGFGGVELVPTYTGWEEGSCTPLMRRYFIELKYCKSSDKLLDLALDMLEYRCLKLLACGNAESVLSYAHYASYPHVNCWNLKGHQMWVQLHALRFLWCRCWPRKCPWNNQIYIKSISVHGKWSLVGLQTACEGLVICQMNLCDSDLRSVKQYRAKRLSTRFPSSWKFPSLPPVVVKLCPLNLIFEYYTWFSLSFSQGKFIDRFPGLVFSTVYILQSTQHLFLL